jgi:putative Mg2+ transporter-C (MgtC) family protein
MDILSALSPQEASYLFNLLICLICGIIIGTERELKGRPAGISTQTLVIGASMTFTFLSALIFPSDPTRIAAQIVAGVGFLGAGVILRFEKSSKITNLTTAASIWFAAAIGMAIGFNYHMIALTATAYVIFVGLMPRISRDNLDEFTDKIPRFKNPWQS